MKFCRARSVPIHLKEKINDELRHLEQQGIITRVNHASNASPVVWVKKENGNYRVCRFQGYSQQENRVRRLSLQTIEEIFVRIGNSIRFAKLDLKSTYHQIELDDHAKSLSCINTRN